jgi:hypothetical protein
MAPSALSLILLLCTGAGPVGAPEPGVPARRAEVTVVDSPVAPARLAELPAPETVTPLRRADLPLSGPFSAEWAPFALRMPARGRIFAYRVAAIAVLPGEIVELAVDGGSQGYTLRPGLGNVADTMPSGWRWTAPSVPGPYAFRVEGPTGSVHVNVFVLVPRSAMEGEYLNGYRIGAYRVTASQPHPRGFVEVRDEDADLLVSPHFTVGQLLCKQPGSPRYIVLSVPLVMKLEAILARVVDRGHDARTLHLMSAYRTPWYNRSIGNTTTLSRHLYGEAADIFVDVDQDGYMDDLNGDGRRDVADARALFDLVEAVEQQGRAGLSRILAGGMKAYRRNQVRGPFLHVDVRGRAARW